jgi:hypothetical protein
MIWIGSSAPFILLDDRPERLEHPQRRSGYLTQRNMIGLQGLELIELSLPHQGSHKLFGKPERLDHEAVVAENFHKAICLKWRKLVMIAD